MVCSRMHSFLQLLLTPSRGMNLWRAAHLEDQATPHKVEYRRGAAVIALAPHSEGEGGALIVHVMQLAGCTGRFALQPCSRPSTGSAVCLLPAEKRLAGDTRPAAGPKICCAPGASFLGLSVTLLMRRTSEAGASTLCAQQCATRRRVHQSARCTLKVWQPVLAALPPQASTALQS